MTAEPLQLPVTGRETEQVTGYPTELRASRGEDPWPVPCDVGTETYEEWIKAHPKHGAARFLLGSEGQALWDDARECHTASLRRIGWLDQKGRVWTEIPSAAGFDGGSLDAILIDVRERP